MMTASPMTQRISRQPRLWAWMLAALMTTASTAEAQVIWSDEFNAGSAPDSAVWSYDVGGGGWGNSELQTYTSDPANVRVEGGNLIITAREQLLRGGRKSYTSARIKTQNKVAFTYGTIEARIKVPDLRNGLWPAFWTLGNNFSQVGWPACGELDIMEMGHSSAIADGMTNKRVGSAAHWEHSNQKADYGLFHDAASDLSQDYHIYRMEWTPYMVSTYVDGNWIWSIDISSGACTDCEEFHRPMFILLNLAVGGIYTGITSASAITAPMPAAMYVDYVRIYDNGYTVLGGSAFHAPPSGSATTTQVGSIAPGM